MFWINLTKEETQLIAMTKENRKTTASLALFVAQAQIKCYMTWRSFLYSDILLVKYGNAVLQQSGNKFIYNFKKPCPEIELQLNIYVRKSLFSIH